MKMSSPSLARRPNRRDRQGPPRRKIARACEPCRERKSRCDGKMPICSSCEKRSIRLEQCIYSSDSSAQSESHAAYIRSLHNRIRELESTCQAANVPFPVSDPNISALEAPSKEVTLAPSDPASESSPQIRTGRSSEKSRRFPSDSLPIARVVGREKTVSRPDTLLRPEVHAHISPRSELESHVTAMGAISTLDDEGEILPLPDDDYYGSSSIASFMRLARQSVRLKTTGINAQINRANSKEPTSNIIAEACRPSTRFAFDDFPLPPRALADHLLDAFWDRVFCLYPFFHRPSFEKAYEILWISNKQSPHKLTDLNIGLGSKWDSGLQSLTFQASLNIVFALGCHFAEIPEDERQELAFTFFLRAKQHIGLDLLDIKSLGVVHTLLLTTVFLQSTPFPNRCWNSVGMACRVAQGLGLHRTIVQGNMSLLEVEIRRRTWHGCIILDKTVSMTHGRPCMTTHLSTPPLPSEQPLPDELQEDNDCLSMMVYYIATIQLYSILDIILGDVYHTWLGQSTQGQEVKSPMERGSLDIIIKLEEKLSGYEANLPSFLSWLNMPSQPEDGSASSNVMQLQRNVLHARYLYFCLLLYRPIFTQVCSDRTEDTRTRAQDQPGHSQHQFSLSNSVLYSSVSIKCAVECVTSAINLISLIFDTYQTSVTDAWWYNGFYISTAGLVVIMSLSSKTIMSQFEEGKFEDALNKCKQILGQMTSFSPSASNTLNFLQAAYAQATSGISHRDAGMRQSRENPSNVGHEETAATLFDTAMPSGYTADMATSDNPLDWNDTIATSQDLGFLGASDFPDLPMWFSDLDCI